MLAPILAVDDDPSVHTVLRVMFRQWNDLALDLALDGHNALERLAEREYRLVISDVQMPQLDGLGLLEEVRKRFPTLPVVMLTGARDPSAPAKALQLGALDYLEKPVRAVDLRSVIDSAIAAGGEMRALSGPDLPALPS